MDNAIAIRKIVLPESGTRVGRITLDAVTPPCQMKLSTLNAPVELPGLRIWLEIRTLFMSMEEDQAANVRSSGLRTPSRYDSMTRVDKS